MSAVAQCLSDSDDFDTWMQDDYIKMSSDTYDNMLAGCESNDYDFTLAKKSFMTTARATDDNPPKPSKSVSATTSTLTASSKKSTATAKATPTANATGSNTAGKTTGTTATATATSTDSSDSKKGGLSTGAKAGIGAVSGFAGLAVIGGLVFFFLRHRATHKENETVALNAKPYKPLDDYNDGAFGGGGNRMSAAGQPFIRNSGYDHYNVSPDSRNQQVYSPPLPQQQFGAPQPYGQQHLAAAAVPAWHSQAAGAGQDQRYEPYSSGRMVSPAVTPPPATGPQPSSGAAPVFEMDSSGGAGQPAPQHAQMPHMPPSPFNGPAASIASPLVTPETGYYAATVAPAPRHSQGPSFQT